MPCKSLLALPLVCPLLLFLVGSVSPYAYSSPTLPAAPSAPAPQVLDVTMPPALPIASPTNAAPEPPAPPEPGQPRTHTLTIYNGDQVQQQTFVWCHGSWRTCGEGDQSDVCFHHCPSSPYRCQGAYPSPRCDERVACSLRGNCNLASARHPCR